MKKWLLFLAFIISFKGIKAQVAANLSDSLALVAFYDSTGGANWYTSFEPWLTSPVSTWYGVTLNSNGRVTDINLQGNNLIGTIPFSLSKLTQLNSLVISQNNLTGNIPIIIPNLTNLKILDLSGNQLNGTIPSAIGNLKNLTTLSFAGNQLSGSIPSTIGNLVNLTDLELGNNQLTGGIPSTIGNLKKLYNLNIFNNQLTGNIPSTIGNMISLQEINLYSNQLSGTIPSTLSNLDSVSVLEIFGNNFTFAGMNLVANFVLNQAYFGAGTIDYSPQANVPLNNKKNILSVSVGGNPQDNTFQWYKDGNLVATNSDSTFTASTAGQYWVVATNSACVSLDGQSLTLYSDTLTVFNLPVEIINFTINDTYNYSLLDWQTSSELNTSHFIIQHSTDGTSFTDVGTVKAIGIGTNSYGFTDTHPANGINYYRLESVDKDGEVTYSKVVSIDFSIVNNQLSIYPNPVRDNLSVQITNDKKEIVSVAVYDLLGKLIKRQQVALQSGKTNFSVSTGALAKGSYILVVRGEETKQQLFIKE